MYSVRGEVGRQFTVVQCDQMLEQKVAKLNKKAPKSSHRSFCLKVMFFKIAQKVNLNFGYFSMKICQQDLS